MYTAYVLNCISSLKLHHKDDRTEKMWKNTTLLNNQHIVNFNWNMNRVDKENIASKYKFAIYFLF